MKEKQSHSSPSGAIILGVSPWTLMQNSQRASWLWLCLLEEQDIDSRASLIWQLSRSLAMASWLTLNPVTNGSKAWLQIIRIEKLILIMGLWVKTLMKKPLSDWKAFFIESTSRTITWFWFCAWHPIMPLHLTSWLFPLCLRKKPSDSGKCLQIRLQKLNNFEPKFKVESLKKTKCVCWGCRVSEFDLVVFVKHIELIPILMLCRAWNSQQGVKPQRKSMPWNWNQHSLYCKHIFFCCCCCCCCKLIPTSKPNLNRLINRNQSSREAAHETEECEWNTNQSGPPKKLKPEMRNHKTYDQRTSVKATSID